MPDPSRDTVPGPDVGAVPAQAQAQDRDRVPALAGDQTGCPTPEQADILIIGAGLAGIGTACYLRREFPGRTIVILEARADLGGTWDLFRYPGVRSDSDMITLGYRFRPWRGSSALADGPSILSYLRATAREHRVDELVRYQHRVLGAAWDGTRGRWTVSARRDGSAEPVRIDCSFLVSCTGYYRHDQGHSPAIPGRERFGGQVVHPQHWPADLDHSGRRVAVIGSGATAVTCVPALARTAAHVTLLQRSASYVVALPREDPASALLRRVLPERAAFALARSLSVAGQSASYQLCRRRPALARRLLRRQLERHLPAGYAIDPHFTPRYDPWDQRMCVAADGDLFHAIRRGTVTVVTGEIETFTEDGLLLTSGERVPADLVVTATGLTLQALGGARLVVDGRAVDLPEALAYKGMMLTDVPNFAFVAGYMNASYTLRVDLVGEYLCRLLAHMDRRGHTRCTPRRDEPVGTSPLISLSAGYVRRGIDTFPRQGDRAPYRMHTSYLREAISLRHGRLDDAVTFH